ncbi:MAG: alanine--tRNA ligase [Bdellovibrionales bacterium]|nr:alanine--tRNA ligase [Bdellovibrionales bacterium]
MKYAEIRKAFVEYFEKHSHQAVASSSLIPHNDPTLMFTNAGMNQFKDVFLGTDKRSYNRAVTIQKCLRAGGKHNDLENVGFTARHHTFFEMLGNFSFGDYFKKEAIRFAWDFLTNTLEIPKERLYVTVFETDDEAAEIWHQQEGVPKDRIYRYGEKDNFWRMGQTGPCGPCSEIFYDHNPDGPKIPLHEDEDRFVEIWNLVFMQFFEDEEGKQTPLPKPSVDTGSGIERVAAAMQGHRDNYQTDVFQPLIDKCCEMAGLSNDWKSLSKDPEILGAVKVVADHARAAAFLIAEGVLPSNDGRGYVLRRIMRRAIRYARKLNDEKSIYPEVCEVVLKTMAPFYPELIEKSSFITQTVYDEEKRFLQTLDHGSEILEEQLKKLKKSKQKTLDGEVAFTLYDTYGFPLDLTELIAREKGFEVDSAGFETHMEAAKDKARKAHKSHGMSRSERILAEMSQEVLQKYGATRFVGYGQLTLEVPVLAISDGSGKEQELYEDHGWFAVEATPFYAEGGGQVGDHGRWTGTHGEGVILDCIKLNDIFLHEFKVENGHLSSGHTINIEVTSKDRQATANNHSATHLMHAALKKVLGDHVGQAGSLVNPFKLRFDFTHNAPLSTKEISAIESLVNEQIAISESVSHEILPYQQAVDEGAVAMFGEKYDDDVRVISMGGFSKELCGGTHVRNTSQIRLFKIITETGVSAGVRRIEAVTGDIALQYLNQLAMENLATRKEIGLTAPKDVESFKAELTQEVINLKSSKQQLEKDLQKLKSKSVSVDDLMKDAKETQIKGQKGIALITRVNISERNVLSDVADKLRAQHDNLIVVLIGEGEAQKPLIVAASKSLKGVHAGKITQELCTLLGGKGGGRPDFAQGSAATLDNIAQAKDKFYELIQ